MKPVYVVVLSIMAALATPRDVSAGPADASASDAEASAREHFQRGQRLSASGQYAAAYREFAAGYALSDRPLFLFNMAEAARANGELLKARESYQQFLRLDPNSVLAATAKERLAALDASSVGAPPPHASGTTGAPRAVTSGPPQPAADGRPPLLLPPPSSVGAAPAGTRAAVTSAGPAGGVARTADTPIWKKWPFWAVVGGVVAGSALVLAASRDDSVCGAGCTQLSYR